MIKKLSLLLMASLFGLPSIAGDFQYTNDGQTLTYTVLDEDAKTVSVKDGSSAYGDLYMPSKVTDGTVEYTVKAIGESAFVNSRLSTVELPEKLTAIGGHAFEGQKELYYIEFPDGLEEIGDYAFSGCKLLEFPSLPESLTMIGEYAFWNCSTQAAITLPRNIQSLGKGAFREMTKLKKAVLFSDLEAIPDELCAGCTSLENLYLPQQLKTIGDFAFLRTSVDEVIFPKTLETIGRGAFAVGGEPNGAPLTEIIDAINRVIQYDEPQNQIAYGPSDSGKLTKVSFPENLKEIHSFAFISQPLNRIEFKDGLKVIGNGAFCFNCLTSLSLPTTVEEIGDYAFMHRYNPGDEYTIGTVTLPSLLNKLGYGVFGANTKDGWGDGNIIGSMNVGSGLTELNVSVGRPKNLIIGENVKRLSPKAVFGRENLIKVLQVRTKTPPTASEEFPLSDNELYNILVIVKDGTKDLYLRNPYWKVFGSNLVEESESSISVYVDGQYPISEEIRTQSGLMPSQVLKMKVRGKLADSDWRLIRENMISLISLDLSGISNTEIPDDAFKGMTMLTEVILPAKTTRIGNSAFDGCSMLSISELPDGIKEIGNFAFRDCQCITISRLPEALEKLGFVAFKGCCSIKTLTAGSNLRLLYEENVDPIYGDDYSRWGFETFKGCLGLEYVDLSASKIERMYDYFKDCQNLTTILLPNTVEIIGNEAFAYTGLESFEFPSNIDYVGICAFKKTNIRGVTIPEGIKKIGLETFAECPKLLNVNFPQSLSEIGENIFRNNNKLTSISCRAITAPIAADGAFADMNRRKCGLTVPQQSFRSYLNAPGWGGFQNILNRLEVECPDEDVDLTAIDEEEYQEITEEEELRQEAEESAEGDDNGDENEEDNPEQPTPQMMRVKVRQQLAKGTYYAQLFNGATVATPNTTKGTRIFVNTKGNAELIGVYYNDVDVTAQMEGNSYLLPVKADGTLVIKVKPAGIDDVIYTPDGSATCTAYDFMGRAVYTGARNQFDSSVAPGLYVVKSGSKTEKVIVK